MSNPGASLRWGRIFVTAVGMVLIASAIGVLLAQNEKDVKRPAGWSETTHGKVHPDYKRLFAMDKVHEIHIAIQPEQYRVMQEDLAQIGPGGMGRGLPPLGRGADGPRGGRGGRGAFRMSATDPIYVPVTVTYDGHEWTRVGMRYKGNSSLMGGRGGKLPFRLEFAQYEKEFPAVKDQRFYGFEKLTFSSNMSDDSQLREVLATEVLRDRGVAAARAAFYRVMVDPGTGPEYWGLYSMIEDPADGAMLDAQFGSHHGNLYKPEGPGADWTYFDKEGFSKKNNKKEAEFKDVESAIAALNARANNPRAWRSALEARFDVDMFLRWLAVNTVINSWDAYGAMPHNYYLYSDPEKDGRLVWIPWDHNMSFGSGPGGARGLPGRGGGRGGPEGPAGPGFFPPDLPGGGPFPPGADPGRGFGPPPGGRGFPRGGQGAPGNGVPPFGPEGFPGDAFPGGRGFPPFGGSSGDVLHRQVGDQWPLIQRLMQDEVYSARYRELLVYAMVGLASPAAFEKRVRELHAMIASAVVGPRGETTSHTLSSPEAFERSLNSPDGPIQQLQSREEAIRTALAEVTRR